MLESSSLITKVQSTVWLTLIWVAKNYGWVIFLRTNVVSLVNSSRRTRTADRGWILYLLFTRPRMDHYIHVYLDLPY